METRRRRSTDAFLLGLAVVLVGGAAVAGAVAAASERITGLWAGAQVGAGGAARIVEVIDYDFGSRRRHGIFRDVPGLDPADPVQVASPSAPAQVEVSGTAHQTRLRIGDPERTVRGRHRYTIGYRLAGVAPGGRLAWDAVGTAWPVGIARAELHVAAPYRLEDARCVQGGAGSQAPCPVAQPEPGHLVATVEELDAGEGVTLYATAGTRLAAAPALPGPPAPPANPGTGPVPPALVAAAAAVVAAAATSRLIRRAGREQVAPGGAAEAAFGGHGTAGYETRVDTADLARLATIEFVPPRELTPAQGGVLLAEAVHPEHKVAWLIGAAVDGHLDLEDDGGQVTLVRLPRRHGTATYLLDVAFEGRDRLTLGSYDPSFASAWQLVGSELDGWRRTSPLWDPAGDRRRALALTLGAVAGVAGLLLTALGGALASRWGAGWLVLAAAGGVLAGAGAAAVVRAWELRVRTMAGSGLWLRTESFRRFLAGSEAHHAEEAAKRGYLREYTAWAVAVGELDRWSRAVAASSAAQADPGAARYPVMVPALLSGSSEASKQPSSSGSSGGWSSGGGGGVGGGAGGGGGGSW
ncbi:MAG TPA: DUF2207 domain-containing protein [Actinomycetota bacterium]|nr:DUF2207 domain-containing protein [Actinomycetota bacterium]